MIEVMPVILGNLRDSTPSCRLTVRLDVGAHKAIGGRACGCLVAGELVQAAIVVVEIVERWHLIILRHCRDGTEGNRREHIIMRKSPTGMSQPYYKAETSFDEIKSYSLVKNM